MLNLNAMVFLTCSLPRDVTDTAVMRHGQWPKYDDLLHRPTTLQTFPLENLDSY